jgi:rfaE bifunctional protein kinase chain/domain
VKLSRFHSITVKYPRLRIGVIGDFCLDRYLEIDPARQETSIETGLPVHNVVNVRSQPGAAGTILNNLAALGIGEIHPVGFAGNDGEGVELCRALRQLNGVKMDGFFYSKLRRTFTYTKPLVLEPGKPPVELNRLDFKNWSPTPTVVQGRIIGKIRELASEVDALILLEQVDRPETGVITRRVLDTIQAIAVAHPKLPIIADSRRGLLGYPPVCFKMNAAELAALTGGADLRELDAIMATALKVARRNGRAVFVTLSERGILGASPSDEGEHVPALPVRGEIDIVGAGDAVTANLVAALAAGADLRETLEVANMAASVVVHQLGTTGTASVAQIEELLKVSAEV